MGVIGSAMDWVVGGLSVQSVCLSVCLPVHFCPEGRRRGLMSFPCLEPQGCNLIHFSISSLVLAPVSVALSVFPFSPLVAYLLTFCPQHVPRGSPQQLSFSVSLLLSTEDLIVRQWYMQYASIWLWDFPFALICCLQFVDCFCQLWVFFIVNKI